jgi:hypothetical protein
LALALQQFFLYTAITFFVFVFPVDIRRKLLRS